MMSLSTFSPQSNHCSHQSGLQRLLPIVAINLLMIYNNGNSISVKEILVVAVVVVF